VSVLKVVRTSTGYPFDPSFRRNFPLVSVQADGTGPLLCLWGWRAHRTRTAMVHLWILADTAATEHECLGSGLGLDRLNPILQGHEVVQCPRLLQASLTPFEPS